MCRAGSSSGSVGWRPTRKSWRRTSRRSRRTSTMSRRGSPLSYWTPRAAECAPSSWTPASCWRCALRSCVTTTPSLRLWAASRILPCAGSPRPGRSCRPRPSDFCRTCSTAPLSRTTGPPTARSSRRRWSSRCLACLSSASSSRTSSLSSTACQTRPSRATVASWSTLASSERSTPCCAPWSSFRRTTTSSSSCRRSPPPWRLLSTAWPTSRTRSSSTSRASWSRAPLHRLRASARRPSRRQLGSANVAYILYRTCRPR
mmetsp:Transcript_17049/g.66430  ORF Transcript_17049/g.66430 Transcript_17049/m.66430 type:complete len:259 (-) Transcript_17049:1009-1785(-)